MAAASEPPMVEQVITEFFAKSLHIILESRSPFVSSRSFARPSPPASPLSGTPPRDRWFNLALRDCPAALENFDLWRQSNLEPLVIDIVLLHRDQTNAASAGGSKIVERWVIQYETHKAGNGNGNSSKSSGRKSRCSSAQEHSLYRTTYKGSTVLLRSLYLVVRLLPAYNLFRELNSSGRIRSLSLSHKLSSFVEPFTRTEDAEMNHHVFAPIETLFGSLSLSVSYVPVLEVAADSEPTTPMSTELIMDYVGSPTTDFLKRFQPLPSAGTAPACSAMTRRHSWSIEHGAGPSASPSPSPTYSEPCALHSNQSPHLPPRGLMRDNTLTTFSHPHNVLSSGQKRIATFEECYPSLPLSPSPSHSPGSHCRNLLFRCESAPLSIAAARAVERSSRLHPSPCLKGKHQCSSQNNSLSAQVQAAPDNKLNVKDLIRMGDIESENAMPKVLSITKGDLRYFHGLKLPRTSNKHIIMDEWDDLELVFAGDDREIITDQLNRKDLRGIQEAGSSVALTRSPAAAIVALRHMLKAAPALRDKLPSITSLQVPQEPSVQSVMTEEPDNAAASSALVPSGLSRSRTAADALEELKKYKVMRESILSYGRPKPPDTDLGEQPAVGNPSHKVQ